MGCRLFSTENSASQIIRTQAIETLVGYRGEDFLHCHEVTIPRFGQFVEVASFCAKHFGTRSWTGDSLKKPRSGLQEIK
jgi:hypothetical protein